MHGHRTPLASLFLIAAGSGCGLQITPSSAPSSWAMTYPDTTPVTSGRVVRFAANYGLLGPSPAFVFRDVNGEVTGQMLVWYRRYEPADAGGRSAADSAAEWSRMQSAMSADRARFNGTYRCTSWAKGYQEGNAWVCRVPSQGGHVDWAVQLTRLDSLVQARPQADAGPARRPNPVAPPPPPANPGVAQLPKGARPCMDGGSWSVAIRDSRGTREIMAPQPSGGCPQPEGPAKTYDDAGWRLLREFIAAVKYPTAAILGGWRGSSICVKATWNDSCADEEVVYSFVLAALQSEQVTLHASKLVAGKPQSMGDLDFVFDSTGQTWFSDFQNRRVNIRWTYRVKGDSLIGHVAEMPSGRVARRVNAVRMP